MREERRILSGNQTIAESLELWGNVVGDVTIINGGKVYVRSNIFGNLTVEDGGRVHVYGNVQRDLTVNEGAKVILSGIVGGDAINRGGRLYVEASAKIIGKLRRKAGDTVVDSKAQVKE